MIPCTSQSRIKACAALVFIMIVLRISHVSGTSPVYNDSEIPAFLKENAKAVIRSEEQVLTIKSTMHAHLNCTRVITILNENGFKYACFMELTNKFRHVSNIRGTIYNSLGQKVEQLTMERTIDHSAIAPINLYDDNRVLFFEPRYRTYPFTVEYHFEVTLDGFNSFPSWEPCPETNISVEKSVFRVVTTDSALFRYYCVDPQLLPHKERRKDLLVFTWELKDLPVKEAEPFAFMQEEYLPTVHFAPNAFTLEGFNGNHRSWKEFGNWIRMINSGRDLISEEKKNFITDLVKDCSTDFEKAQRIYHHFQESTRYVSIQIGIGGWQPMKASEVEKLGYGDCKALANYLRALFTAGGLNSYYTLVRAGAEAFPVIPEFPAQQFNHIILCLTLGSDTTWVECTDQKLPFGYTGIFTDDRHVLVINEEGGHLVRTSRLGLLENHRVRSIKGLLDEEGNASFCMEAENSGLFFEHAFVLLRADVEHQKKLVFSAFSFPGLTIDSFNYRMETAQFPIIHESIHAFAPHYGAKAGDRILIPFNRLFESVSVPPKSTTRKSKVHIRRDFVLADTLVLSLPQNYIVESLPENHLVESRFGSCAYTFEASADKISFTRIFTMHKGIHHPETYPQLLDFLTKVAADDNQKVCLKRKT